MASDLEFVNYKQFVEKLPVASSYATGDKSVVSNGANGPRQMPQTTAEQIAAQNALAGNVAPAFDSNKPNDAGGYAYYSGDNVSYLGKNYVFVVNHSSGAWNPNEVEHKPLSESINLQGVGEAVDEWLNRHPEATTTVQNGSLTEAKFSDPLKLKTIKDYVTPEMFGAKGDGIADDTEAVNAAASSGKDVAFIGTYIISDNVSFSSKTSLIFLGGSIDADGHGLQFDNNLLLGKVNIVDAITSGKINNEFVKIEWFGTSGSLDNYVSDVVALASRSGADVYFEKTTYTLSIPIFVFNKCNIFGNNCTIQFDGNSQVAIMFGSDSIGGDGLVWSGKFERVNIEVLNGDYNCIMGCFNAKDVEICYTNITSVNANCFNKLIGLVNNANFVIPSAAQKNYYIHHNTTMVHEDPDRNQDRNNCECIGITNRHNITVCFNDCYHTRDDLGVHDCSNVRVENNRLIDAYDGRIYFESCQDVAIKNNEINYKYSGGNGVYVETSMNDANSPKSERIVIENNIVDYSAIGSNIAWYGVYVAGARKVSIRGNRLISPYSNLARIYLNNQSYSGTTFDSYPENSGKLVPCEILIEGNECNSVFFTCGTNIVDNVVVRDNIFKAGFFMNNSAIVVQNNKFIAFTTTQSNLQGSFADICPRFSIDHTPSSSYEDMLYDGGSPAFVALCDLCWCGRYVGYMDVESVSGSYIVQVYVDGVLADWGHMEIKRSGEYSPALVLPDYIGVTPLIIKKGKKISVKIKVNTASSVEATKITFIPLLFRN